ncbi:hypothetical protein Syun_015578 [Stephania yunnanensis]|uniref:Uncharacterized protein n=1 Tax=Stephania yunnanensis TaxID=152371 RepID=A0AAP0JN51_9MAGN
MVCADLIERPSSLAEQFTQTVDTGEVFQPQRSLLELINASVLQLIRVKHAHFIVFSNGGCPDVEVIGSGVVREALHEEFEWRDRRGRSLRRGYRFEDEDRVVGDQCAAALAADDRVLDEFPIAGEADRLDYRRGVLLHSVTNRIIRIGRSGTIIIDAETAPDVNHPHSGAETDQFAVNLGGLADPVGQQCSGGNLGANVEMQKLKAIKHSFRLKPLRDAQYLRRREPKLALLAGSRPKMTGVLGPQLRPHPDHRSNPHLPTDFDNQFDLLLLLEHNHSVQFKPPRHQCKRHILCILVPITDQEAIRAPFTQTTHRQQKLRLRPRLQPEPMPQPELHHVLHDEPVLVTLHRVDALVMRLIPLRLNRKIKGPLKGLHPILQYIRKPHNEGQLKPQSAAPLRLRRLLHHLRQLDFLVRQRRLPVGAHRHVPGGVHGEVGLPPAVDLVQGGGHRRRPMRGGAAAAAIAGMSNVRGRG